MDLLQAAPFQNMYPRPFVKGQLSVQSSLHVHVYTYHITQKADSTKYIHVHVYYSCIQCM